VNVTAKSDKSRYLVCKVVETPKGAKEKQKTWQFKAQFLGSQDKEPKQLKSRHLKSLVIEAYPSWSWVENTKGKRHKELTAHIGIREKDKERQSFTFASGGDYKTSKK